MCCVCGGEHHVLSLADVPIPSMTTCTDLPVDLRAISPELGTGKIL